MNAVSPRISRRHLLQSSGIGYLGLSLGGLLRAQIAQAAEISAVAKPAPLQACILIFYYGGPSHLDTWDMKPDGPAEVRGEFRPIATSAPGVRICEHLPQTAKIMHKAAIVRSMHHGNRLHDAAAIETLTGRPLLGGDRELFSPLPQFYPSFGGALAYLRRDRNRPVSHAALPFTFRNVHDVPCQGAGFLGTAFNPLLIEADPDQRIYRAQSLTLPADLTTGRLSERRALLAGMEVESAATSEKSLRRFHDRAIQLLSSPAVGQALDLSREPVKVREQYGLPTEGGANGSGNGADQGYGRNMRGQNLLLARRLVEAGVPFVNVYDFKQQGQNWDAHTDNFGQHKKILLPPADQAFAALINDLDQRGLLETTLVVGLGEFGRTPKITSTAGRDHWPDCYSVVLAGGGVKGGYVHGASDRLGAYPTLDPVTPADLAATIYWRFGVNPATLIHDPTGRPHRLAEGEPITQLFG